MENAKRHRLESLPKWAQQRIKLLESYLPLYDYLEAQDFKSSKSLYIKLSNINKMDFVAGKLRVKLNIHKSG